MIRLLGLAVIAAVGCGEPEPEVDTAPPISKADEVGRIRASVAAAFDTSPDSALAAMSPDRAPTDVYVATEALARSDGEARVRYAHYLTSQGDRSVAPLAALVDDTEDWQILVAAIQTLGKLRAVDAVKTVTDRLEHENSWVRMASAHALGEIGGEEALKSLESALVDTTDTVVAAALIALGRSGYTDALAACMPLLDHGNPRVRGAAVSAVGRLGSSLDVEILNKMSKDPDDGVRYKVKDALLQIERRETEK